MPDTLAERWFAAFMRTVNEHNAANALRDAAITLRLGKWTQELTRVTMATCDELGWKGASKNHRSDTLPVRREEYLGLDLMAFEPTSDNRWRFPFAIFEFENGKSDDVVAYSLWKVLSVRAALRVVFCYRQDSGKGAHLVRRLADEVINALGISGRTQLGGETMVVVGSRDEASTFPYGFFKEWSLDTNTARFSRM